MATGQPFFQFLDDVGDGTGAIDATGDYSLTPEEFLITAPPGRRYQISRMITTIVDTNGFQASEYGNLGGALTNGISFQVRRGSELQYDLTAQERIRTNSKWASYCYDAQLLTWGAGNEHLAVRWTFLNTGQYIDLRPGFSLVATFNDNLTGLIEHKFQVQGLIFSTVASSSVYPI